MLKLFGTDGIRSIANEYPLTTEVCKKLVHSLVLYFDLTHEETIIIGKDTRESGDTFEKVLADEFSSLGVNVVLVGVVPTPAISYMITENNISLGIMISASHNPYNYNGIKIFNKFGLKLSDTDEQKIEDNIFANKIVKSDSVGEVKLDNNYFLKYYGKILHKISECCGNRKIIVDTSNGSLSTFAQMVLLSFGCDLIAIGREPNGKNINDNCGVMFPNTLVNEVKKNNADIGIAFDGDGDRIILCDENGDIMDGDQILALLSTYEKCDTVVSTIMVNYGLEKFLKNKGIALVRTNVGDRYISDYMQKHPNVMFGGEPSGHIIIREHLLTGDGLYTAVKLLDLFFKSGKKKFSEFCHVFDPVPSITKNVKVKDKKVIENTEVCCKIEKYREQLLNRGRLIVRPSGTEPLIRITAEGEDVSELNSVISDIASTLENL